MSKKILSCSVLLALILVFSGLGVANGADWTFTPRIFTEAQYNDNVEEINGGKGDYVGIVKPGLTTSYDSARVLLNVSYDLEYKGYLDNVRDSETNHWLDAFTKIEAVRDLFFIEVRDSFQKVYEDTTRGDLPDGDTTNGTTDQNIFGVKGYFVVPVQERTNMTFGGEAQDIWYSEDGNVDKRNYDLFLDIDHELSEQWQLMTGAGYEKQDPRWEEGGFQRYNLMLGTKYTYAESSYLELRWEPTRTDYKISSDKDKDYHPYFAGVTHAFTQSLIGNISTSMEFTEDPRSSDTQNEVVHQAGITNQYDRGDVRFAVGYHDYERRGFSSRTTYWKPSLSGSHGLTEKLSFGYNTYANLYTNPNYDTYWFTRVHLDYSFAEKASVGLSYRYKLNDENGKAADYSSNTIGATLKWTY